MPQPIRSGVNRKVFITISREEKDFIGTLYRQYYPLWFKTAYRLVSDEQTAADMINDTFVKLICKSGLLREMDKNAMMTYVVNSIENTCKSFLAKEKRIESTYAYIDEDMLLNISDNISVENTVLKNIDISILRKVISDLDSKDRMIIILSYYEGLGDRQIAEQMQMSYSNMRMYRFRLLAKIRKRYERESTVNKSGGKQHQ